MVDQVEVDELVAKGLDALSNGHTYLAMTCLEEALQHERTPTVISCLAYCRAANGRDLDQAVALAREALEQEPTNAFFCLNLGRIYLIAGRRREAITIIRHGLAHGKDKVLIDQLESLGNRKPPVIGFLSRSNPINKYLGLLLSRLGIR